MRLTDEQVDREISKWLDELAIADAIDNKAPSQHNYRKKYSKAYRKANKEAYNAYMREYQKTWR